MLRKLAAIRTGGYQLSTPAAARDGRLFLTFTSGAQCAYSGNYSQCPGLKPDSCRNYVKTFSPRQSAPQPLFTIGGSRSITGQVVPSPDAREVALTLSACTDIHGKTGLFVRNLKTGAMHSIVASSNVCDGFGPAAWTRTGRLVFPVDRAGGRPIEIGGGLGCPAGRSYLALAPANKTSKLKSLKLIDPDPGCIFKAAAFDRAGIAAAEGCSQGAPLGGGNYLGNAYVLQYSPQGKFIRRLPIRPGLEQAVVATEPATHNVLITQDQPANSGYPERDWVWTFNGRHLRLIAYYKTEDAAQILAVPW
jgi:hypothetical protein